ncbi:uncharacterized protein METZ01_LOCUS398532, partial [marine metagenome]
SPHTNRRSVTSHSRRHQLRGLNSFVGFILSLSWCLRLWLATPPPNGNGATHA